VSVAGIVFYSVLLGVGAALIGFVIGLMIDLTSVTVVSILLVAGLASVAGAILFLQWRRRRSRL
jgi:LPXTG-motif cell wall-anchored protein